MLGRIRSALFVLGVTTVCAAQPTPSDRALATQLFKEGRDLMAQKKYAEACRKLEESQRLDPGGGTLLNLAICHEAEGRTATAWAELSEALSVARRDGRADREKLAQTRITALEPKLSRLTIIVPEGVATEGLVIKRDGTDVGRAAWGTAMPVDPGKHAIEVSAPGHESWSTEVEVAAAADKKIVEIPKLVARPVEPEPAPELVPPPVVLPPPVVSTPPPAPRDTPPPVEPKSHVPAYVMLGIGAVGVGVGTYFGIRAISKRAESDDACDPQCDDHAVELNDQAKTAADISTISFAIGAVGLGLGAYFWIDASSSASQTGRSGFASVSGRF